MNFIERVMRVMTHIDIGPRSASPTGCHAPVSDERPDPGEGMTRYALTRRVAVLGPTAALSLAMPLASAHDFKLCALRIDHPYAIPAPTGASHGAAYLRGICNTGDQADRPVGASTPVAHAVEIHRSVVDAQNVMRMRAIDGIDLPPKAERQLRHGGEHHLMLIGLKQPLQNGDRFPMTLRFQSAGEHEVMVWVQQPRDASRGHDHKH